MPFESDVADYYVFQTLDCVVEIAHAVYHDLLARPEKYSSLDAARVTNLYEFQHVGNDPNWPTRELRESLFASMLGVSDATRPQPTTGSKFASLRLAAVRYSEASPNAPLTMLRAAFVDEVRASQKRLRTVSGGPFEVAHQVTKGIFERASEILKADVLAKVFGKKAPVTAGWPGEGADGEGALLINQITNELQPGTTGVIEEDTFMALQDAAKYGKDAITSVADEGYDLADDAKVIALITATYQWERALTSYRAS